MNDAGFLVVNRVVSHLTGTDTGLLVENEAGDERAAQRRLAHVGLGDNAAGKFVIHEQHGVAALGLVRTKTIGDADHLIRAAGVAGVGYLIAHTEQGLDDIIRRDRHDVGFDLSVLLRAGCECGTEYGCKTKMPSHSTGASSIDDVCFHRCSIAMFVFVLYPPLD